MAVTLNPTNPTNFTQDGTQKSTPGTTLTLSDATVADFIAFYAADPDAAAGTTLDVVATFQITSTVPAGADADNRIVISDGSGRAAIASCIVQNGTRGIGLLSSGPATDVASYPVFVAVDWQAAPVTVRLRRYANGDAEIIQVNSAAPATRALLAATSLPGPTRNGFSTVEFGCSSVEGMCTVGYTTFRSEVVAAPSQGTLNFTRLRIRDSDSTDKVALRVEYTLAAGSPGIDPTSQPVTVQLSTAAGQFYPTPDFNPINGFTLKGTTPKRRWTISDSERTRTGLEQLFFDEDPNNKGSFVLRDLKTDVTSVDFSSVTVKITVGTANTLSGTASLVQKPPGSGKWRLTNE
jgi:hypothetical protein